MLVIEGARDSTLKIVEFFASPAIRVFSEPDRGVYDAMNKGFRRFSGDVIGFLNRTIPSTTLTFSPTLRPALPIPTLSMAIWTW